MALGPIGLCDLSCAFHHCSKDMQRVRAGVLVRWHSNTAALSVSCEEGECGAGWRGVALADEVRWRRDVVADQYVPRQTRRREKEEKGQLKAEYGECCTQNGHVPNHHNHRPRKLNRQFADHGISITLEPPAWLTQHTQVSTAQHTEPPAYLRSTLKRPLADPGQNRPSLRLHSIPSVSYNVRGTASEFSIRFWLSRNLLLQFYRGPANSITRHRHVIFDVYAARSAAAPHRRGK
ncbi:hypothetical protein C8J57DRAFT_1220063 [Mycena rebaudengoi]|nr:hypothetical protein C8J57DRAFT_1220063 [Mycena rebaudengoi]